MTRELVLDASVLAKWYHTDREEHLVQAHRLRDEYESGNLMIVVPPLLPIELLNVAARRWRATPEDVEALARDLMGLALTVQQPPLERVAYWAGRGLTAYDACYVALAEERRTMVVTQDEAIIRIAGALASSLDAATSAGEG